MIIEKTESAKELKIKIICKDFAEQFFKLAGLEELAVEEVVNMYKDSVNYIGSTYYIGDHGVAEVEILITKDE